MGCSVADVRWEVAHKRFCQVKLLQPDSTSTSTILTSHNEK